MDTVEVVSDPEVLLSADLMYVLGKRFGDSILWDPAAIAVELARIGVPVDFDVLAPAGEAPASLTHVVE